MQIRIGTRKSKLALIQANIVIDLISAKFSDIECVLVPIITTGDKITDKNLYDIGGKALFLKELEEELLDNKIDIAVHSLKDVPGLLPKDLSIAATLEREDPRDCFVSFQYKSIEDLPIGAVVGSSSVRRKVILQNMRPDLQIVQFRGNINTRLQKLKNKEVDATILACAGLIRGGLFNLEYCYPLEVNQMLPAAGQGVIAIEICTKNKEMQDICNQINHPETWALAAAERGLLSYMDASCRTPLSAYAIFEGNIIKAHYMMSDIAGKNIQYHHEVGNIETASEMGIKAAIVLSN
jgi:hydroxymethylbilane synthase